MFELCRAVNERQAALDLTKTQFFKADGTEAADITLADLLNIEAMGVDCYAFQNLTRVRDAIISMVNGGNFTETSGRSDLWTKANLETAIGADLDADPIRPQEARYWQAMQDALDLLIYGFANAVAPGVYYDQDSSLGRDATGQDAWDNRHDETITVFGVAAGGWGMGVFVYRAFVNPGITGLTFPTAAYSGSLAEAYYRGNSVWTNTTLSTLRIGVGTDEFDITGAVTNGEWLSADAVIGSDTVVNTSVVTTEPATWPFNNASASASLILFSLDLYIDLASVLADQA